MRQTLSAKQRAACQRLTDPEFDGDMARLCQELKVQPTTFYRWWDDPEFKACVQRQIERFAGSAQCNVWRALIKKCCTGDVSAIKLYFELQNRTKGPGKESFSELFRVLQEVQD